MHEEHWIAKSCATKFRNIVVHGELGDKLGEIQEKIKNYPYFYNTDMGVSRKWLK